MKTLSLALAQAMSAGVVASLAVTPAMAQTTEKTERLEITGSRVKRVEAEGALPVTIIERAELEASGQTTVADYMRSLPFSTAGNFRPQSGSSAQGFADIDLRGFGSRRTLVLVDGRRIAKSPIVGESVDMNSIPLAAVERIEILTDGASAIYGSDAIGGVVNVILRKSFEGVAVSYGQTRVSFPEDGGDREEASGILGITGQKGRVIMGASMTKREIIFQRHAYGTAGTRGASVFSNNYFRATGSPLAPVPGGCTNPGFYLSGGLCRYDFVAQAADEAELNTNSFFARGEYNINNNWSAFMTSSVSRVNSFGRYAPVPGFVVIEPGSPAHPWHSAFPDTSLRDRVTEDETLLLGHRFAAGGPRDTDTESNLYDVLVGVKGRVMDRFDVEVGARNSKSLYKEVGRGYVIETLARAEINAGRYNIFDPASTPLSVLQSFTATIGRDGKFDQTEQYANATFDLFRLGGGEARMFVGAEHRKEVYADIYDSLSEGGVVLGSAGNSAAGDRTVRAFSAELVMPFTRQLEVTAAARHERYSDYGSDFSPKVSVRFQPTRNLVLRGSVGEGFAAPTLPQLHGKPAFSAESIVDMQHCLASGISQAECDAQPGIQIQGTRISNPELGSEKAKQWTIGAAWDVTPNVSLTADLWNTKIEDVISNIGAQDIVDRSTGASSLPIPAGLSITRDSTGFITSIIFGTANEGTLEQRGLDLSANLAFNLGRAGSLRHRLTYSRMIDAESNDIDFNGTLGFPENRGQLANMWKMGPFDATWNINWIGKHGDSRGNVPSHVTHDVQFGYATPLRGVKLIVGAINVTEKMPKLVPYDGRSFNYYLYDAYGRQVYGRLELKF